MFDLYNWNTPNGQKIVIALEESKAPYTVHAIDIRKGDQHGADFRAISPDGKIPALVTQTEPVIQLFESGAILVFLAERFPVLHGQCDAERATVLAWTFWQVGQLGPLTGQYGRFKGLEIPNTEGVEHFEQLVWRCLDVLENRLMSSQYLGSDKFTIADIACLPWVASPQSYLQWYEFNWRERCPALMRWADRCWRRSSVERALGPIPDAWR